MEGSIGKLFNRNYQHGVNVIVTNVNVEDGKITFRTTNNLDPIEEFSFYGNDQQDVKNEAELNADEKKYFIEWEIKIEQNDPAIPVPGNLVPNIGNVGNSNYPVGGRYKIRNMRKNKKTKKTKKTKKLKSRKLFKH